MDFNELHADQKRKVHLESAMYKLWLTESGETNEEEISHLRNCLRIALKECLTEKQRMYLLMYMNGFNQREIAQEIGVHPSTVSREIGYALDNLFDHIKYATPRTLHAGDRVRKVITRMYRKG